MGIDVTDAMAAGTLGHSGRQGGTVEHEVSRLQAEVARTLRLRVLLLILLLRSSDTSTSRLLSTESSTIRALLLPWLLLLLRSSSEVSGLLLGVSTTLLEVTTSISNFFQRQFGTHAHGLDEGSIHRRKSFEHHMDHIFFGYW